MDKQNQFINNVNYIKKWYKENKNGLLITNRRIGKTRALIEILFDNNFKQDKIFTEPPYKLYVVVCDNTTKQNFCRQLNKFIMKYDDNWFEPKRSKYHVIEELRKYVITLPDREGRLIPTSRLIIDEYFHQPKLVKRFRFAIGSPQFPIQVTTFDNGVNDKKLKEELSDEAYKLEHSLNFHVYDKE